MLPFSSPHALVPLHPGSDVFLYWWSLNHSNFCAEHPALTDCHNHVQQSDCAEHCTPPLFLYLQWPVHCCLHSRPGNGPPVKSHGELLMGLRWHALETGDLKEPRWVFFSKMLVGLGPGLGAELCNRARRGDSGLWPSHIVRS